jgi:tripartite-type tricarboxylate transporter receptor subunit TctC
MKRSREPRSPAFAIRLAGALLACVLCAAGTLPLAGGGAAEEAAWPARPVVLVVPFPPGGSVDLLARRLAAPLAEALARPFLVENRGGAAGAIGTAHAARAPADGYTFLVAFDTHAVNPALLPEPGFDPLTDFAPVMLIGTAPMALAAQPQRGYRTLADVMTAAQARPAALTYGSIGSGSLGHLTVTRLEQAGGFELVHVPYKGGGPLLQDVLGGHVELIVGSVSLLVPQLRSGHLRALAVTGAERSRVLPDVPTLAEQGFPGLHALSWWAVLAPAKTPAAIVARLHGELERVLRRADVRSALAEELGVDVAASSPEALGRWLREEVARWGQVVREHRIRPDR